jgi:hypothetical protein
MLAVRFQDEIAAFLSQTAVVKLQKQDKLSSVIITQSFILATAVLPFPFPMSLQRSHILFIFLTTHSCISSLYDLSVHMNTKCLPS